MISRAFHRCTVPARISAVMNGSEALDYMLGFGLYENRKEAKPPQLLLVDLKMPRLDGFDLIRTLRGYYQFHEVPIVVLSGSERPEDIRLSYDLGANSYVIKPADPERFEDVVSRIIAYWLSINTKSL